jgi:hypothetical protein
MGKEWEAQILGARLGMAALAVLAAVTAVAIAVTVGGQLRSAMPDWPASDTPGSVGSAEYRPAE